ncbi:site-specific recombinase XerD [Saccharomonospora marina XMU15]|uniref:Site-specific recombinase XerD n=1 Tax=Saccharomonospora marina XMU15 TaxID=882083 RepID=H5X527_9PSEU|nr:tyrosine-type recombinase/integrase [Saccharomonospora marina]EHR53359.1 site-specific recombinase XerD [Saccharomonospora marina XMU15]
MPRKKRSEGTRRPNGASSIYQGSDGKWHGWVTMGTRDDGKPDRRHLQRKTEAEVIDAVRELEKQRDSGKVKKPGRAWTVEKWLTHWFENIAAPSVRHKAANAYRTAVYRHLIPNLGAHRVDKIEPEHFEKLYAKMLTSGLKAGTAHQVHRTARTAFGEALRRGHTVRNPVELAKPPRLEEAEIEPFEADEIGQLLVTALSWRNGVRFVLALTLGTRQGETIGLKWSRLDRKHKALRIAKQLQRQTWKHGCDNPHKCGAKYHKANPCKEDCKRHQRKPCPPPCPPDCTSHARWCPKRHGGGLVEVDVKSHAGKRGIVLPDRLYDLLIAHEEKQAKERELAGSEWHEGDWMFAQPNGKPLDPRRDLDEWKALLEAAGVREARLHDARHTAATVLLVLGVPERAVMEFMGWSNTAMAKRYQHITGALRRDIADRLNDYLWES